MTHQTASRQRHAPQPKILGSDTELGNVLVDERDPTRPDGVRTGLAAATALLDAVQGIAHRRGATARDDRRANPRDVGRKYLLTGGGCCYEDMAHFEICTPETTSAADFVAAWQAMLHTSQNALAAANAALPEGVRVEATVNNSDGHGASWGGHLSVLINRALFDDLCVRPAYVPFGYLASFQVSSIVYAGAGKVGAENGRPAVPFQISQRADFVETLYGWQTTHRRPLVNTRNEALCGPAGGPSDSLARLHVIFYDSTLAPVATCLKAGALQLVLAMLEAGGVGSRHHLKYPLRALMDWSHDPDLRARAELMDGRRLTAVEHQMLVLEDVQAFVASGDAEGHVPHAARLLELWQDTLVRLHDRRWSDLSGRLDWVARRLMIDSAVQRQGLVRESPQAKHLDLLFANLDPQLGLHWAMDRVGLIERLHPYPGPARFMSNPPEDTRAWTRTMLLRRAGPANVLQVDWDRVSIQLPGSGTGSRTVFLADPADHTRADCQAVFASHPELAALVAALAGPEPERQLAALEMAAPPSIH